MNSIPANRTQLTPYQRQLSDTMAQAIPVFPSAICKLTCSYVNVLLFAMEPLEFDSDHRVINPAVRAAIRRVLVSSACGNLLKEAIFQQLRLHVVSPTYRLEFVKMSQEIVAARKRINLDGMILSTVNFNYWDLTNLSARLISLTGAGFYKTNLTGSDFNHAYLHDVAFGRAILDRSSFKYAKFNNVGFDRVSVTGITTVPDLISQCRTESVADDSGRLTAKHLLNTIYSTKNDK